MTAIPQHHNQLHCHCYITKNLKDNCNYGNYATYKLMLQNELTHTHTHTHTRTHTHTCMHIPIWPDCCINMMYGVVYLCKESRLEVLTLFTQSYAGSLCLCWQFLYELKLDGVSVFALQASFAVLVFTGPYFCYL